MENFTRIVNADGSIEYFNNSVVENIVINNPTPQDIAELSAEELEVKILESHKNFVRQERDKRLAECDWTQNIDSPLSGEKKAEWQTYRQGLRDIISTITNTIDVINWPIKP
jgi:hypothetical protein